MINFKSVLSLALSEIRLVLLSICLRIGLLVHYLTWKMKRKYFHQIISVGFYPLFLGHRGIEND